MKEGRRRASCSSDLLQVEVSSRSNSSSLSSPSYHSDSVTLSLTPFSGLSALVIMWAGMLTIQVRSSDLT